MKQSSFRYIDVKYVWLISSDLFNSNSLQIWTGDFNSLTREDYSEIQWKEITSIRQLNKWEKPKTDLTTKVIFSDPKFY